MIDAFAPPDAAENLVFLVQAIAWNDQRDVLPNGFLCGIAEQTLSALVPTRNNTI